MYNVCTIMYTHIRSQASDWNSCVKRLFVCTTETRQRECMYKKIKRESVCVCREVQSLCGQRKREMERVCVERERNRENVCM